MSSIVNPVIREYERTSTTAIDASLKPSFSNYVYELERALTELGYQQDLLMTNSNGGVMKADELAALPICAIKSGPSIGPAAGLYLAEQECLGNTQIYFERDHLEVWLSLDVLYVVSQVYVSSN